MHQTLGLILLVAAVSIALFVGTNYDQISGVGITNFPSLRAVDYVPNLSLPEYSGSSEQAAEIKAASAPMTISSIRPQTPYESGELVLTADWNIPAGGTDIRGWKISTLGNDFAIPGAQEVYTFGGSQDKLIIRPGDEVHLYSGSSPRGNFRINKCIGYLADLGTFNPPLEKSCPAISDSEINYLSNACRSYVTSLGYCETPKNVPVSFNDEQCHEYLNTITYEGCVSRHRNDYDFLSRQIWVWVGDNLRHFDQGGDLIRILDRSGNPVSQYRY